MDISTSLFRSLNKNKKWIVLGAFLYLLPVFYRFATKESVVPILNKTLFIYNSNSQIMLVNLQSLGFLFAIPTAVAALVGTSFLENLFERKFSGFEKYLARVLGSLSFAIFWATVQFIGYNFLNPVGPWGSSVWPSPDNAYVRNFLVALSIGPLLPYIIEFLYRKTEKWWAKRIESKKTVFKPENAINPRV